MAPTSAPRLQLSARSGRLQISSNGAMSRDHFVAQTYLRHFGDPNAGGTLHAYRKTDGREFPCWPKDVCTEWDGDLNDAFPENPGVLGDFRKIFEPYWNPAVQTILEGSSMDS